MEDLDKDIRNKIEFTFADDEAERDPALDIPAHYELYVTSMDDGRALVNVDLGIAEKAPIPRLHWLMGIQMEFLDPDADGFYTEDEEEAILEIQDYIIKVMDEEGRARFVGSVTYAGTRMFYFYGPDVDYLAPLVGKIASEYGDYDFNYMSENDGNWSFFFNAIYPTDLDMAHIRNRYMVQNLVESGVDINHEYSVYYYFYFQDGASRAKAASELMQLGFEVIDDHMYVEELEPMSLGLKMMAKHDLNLMTLTEKTYECFEAMEDNVGVYDGWELAPTEDSDAWI
ncbi:MAG: DUF695 domain-containing protein [Peptococcaceae bacterium]|nr:DUF695 domain-containing protein [Peptococcaceae bacterium]